MLVRGHNFQTLPVHSLGGGALGCQSLTSLCVSGLSTSPSLRSQVWASHTEESQQEQTRVLCLLKTSDLMLLLDLLLDLSLCSNSNPA